MSKCPNTSHPQWKELVQRVGETQAWFLWFDNDSNYPSEQAVRDIEGIVPNLLSFLEKYGFDISDAESLMVNLAGKKINLDKSDIIQVSKALSGPLSEMLSYSEYFYEIEKAVRTTPRFKKSLIRLERENQDSTKRNLRRLATKEIFKDLLESGFSEKLAKELNVEKSILDKIKSFIQELISSLKFADFDVINKNISEIVEKTFKGDDFIRLTKKEGYKEVDFQQAFDENDIAKDIMTKIGTNDNIVLTGSIAYSTQGTVYRKIESVVHDLDFVNTGLSKEEIDSLVTSNYPGSVKAYSFFDKYDVDTYLVPPNGIFIKDIKRRDTGKITSYTLADKDGNVVGTYKLNYEVSNTGATISEEEIKTGVEAMLVDFFSNDNSERKVVKHPFQGSDDNTYNINLSHFEAPFEAKLRYSRFKDIWDYNRFIPTNRDNVQFQLESESEPITLSEGHINYTFKAIPKIIKNINKINEWFKQIKDKDQFYDKVQKDLQIPKDQIELIRAQDGDTFTDKVINFIANYSYAVEINTAKSSAGSYLAGYTLQEFTEEFSGETRYIIYDPEGEPETEASSKKEADDLIKKLNKEKEKPTQHYSNLTVNEEFYKNNPDWEYKEQRITTPLITPSIKGHAQFAQDNDIGWFRAWYNKKTGEVHVLEVQSDLFQKGRDKKDLITNEGNVGDNLLLDKSQFEVVSFESFPTKKSNKGFGTKQFGYSEIFEDNNYYYTEIDNNEYGRIEKSKLEEKPSKENQFLQLLNKDNNWVTFFVKSIIQDSAKKGYEKVLFPRLDTIIQIESAGKFKTYEEAEAHYKDDRWQEIDQEYRQVLREQQEEYAKNPTEKLKQLIVESKERIASHQPSLLNTAKFYEYELANRLDDIVGGNKNNRAKGIWALNQITDEYGNTWNEIELEPSMANDAIQFQLESESEPITLAEFEQQRQQISSDFNADVVFDESLGASAQVEKVGDRNKITVNPNKLFTDTLVHEYGHIMIDGLGGLSNPMIRRGVDLLKGSKIEKQVRETYTNRSEDHIKKEILATAIGLEGADIFYAKQKGQLASFMKWLELFWNRVKGVFGLQQNVAKELARQIIYDSSDISYSIEDTYNFKVKDIPLKNLESLISNKAKSIERQINKYASILEEGTELQKKGIKELKTLLSELQANDTRNAVIKFIGASLDRISHVQTRLDKIEKSKDGFIDVKPSELLQIKDYISAYKGTEEILRAISSDPNYSDVIEELKIQVNQTVTGYQDVENRYLDLSKKYIISLLANSDNNPTVLKYKEALMDEFDRIHKNTGFFSTTKLNGKKVSSDVYRAERSKYVFERLSKLEEKIQLEEESRLREVVERLPRDVGLMDFFYESGNINDDFIQMATQMMGNQHNLTIGETIEDEKKALEVFNKYSEKHKEHNQQKKYDKLIDDELDMDGKPTGKKIPFISGEYNASYYVNFQKLTAAVTDAYNELQADPDNAELKKKHKDATDAKRNWLDANTKPVAGGGFIPTDKWKNNKTFSSEEQLLLEWINESREETFNNYKMESAKLDVSLNGIVYRKLPSVNKTGTERVIESNPVEISRQWFNERFKVRSDDVDYTNSHIALGNEDNRLAKTQPVFFRKQASEQSYDLISIHLMDKSASIQFKNNKKILPTLEIMRDIAANREVTLTQSVFMKANRKIKNLFSNKDDREDLVEDGINSNQYKILSSLIDARLYGIKKHESSQAAKIIDSIIQMSSQIIMTFNYFSAVPNALTGRIASSLESNDISSISSKSLSFADKEYFKHTGSILLDIGKLRPTSYINLLMEKFNPDGSWYGASTRFAKNSRAKQVLDRDLAYATSSTGEHYIYSNLVIAGLKDQKLLTKDGKYLDKEGKITEDANKAASLYEYFGSERDSLILDPDGIFKDAYKTTFSNKPIGEELFTDLSYYIRDIAMSTQGNYASELWAYADKYGAFRAFISLRGWLINGFEKRWRGFSNLNDPDESGRVLDSRRRGHRRSGNYVDTMRFTKSVGKGIRKLQFDIISSDWDSLSSRERANIRKSVAELATYGSIIAVAYVLSRIEDDEEKIPDSVLFTIFSLKRVQSEIAFFMNPLETMRILRSPAASLSMAENVLDLIMQATSDLINWELEEYDRGALKGSTKLKKKIYAVLPGFAQINRDVETALNYLENPGIR